MNKKVFEITLMCSIGLSTGYATAQDFESSGEMVEQAEANSVDTSTWGSSLPEKGWYLRGNFGFSNHSTSSDALDGADMSTGFLYSLNGGYKFNRYVAAFLSYDSTVGVYKAGGDNGVYSTSGLGINTHVFPLADQNIGWYVGAGYSPAQLLTASYKDKDSGLDQSLALYGSSYQVGTGYQYSFNDVASFSAGIDYRRDDYDRFHNESGNVKTNGDVSNGDEGTFLVRVGITAVLGAPKTYSDRTETASIN